MTAPWRTNFLAGFRAIPGLVSLGTFFASKESTSATPKAFKTARRIGENDLEKTSVRAETKRARRIGEKRFRKNKTSVRAKKASLVRNKKEHIWPFTAPSTC